MDQIKAYTIFGRQVGYIVIADIFMLVLGIFLIPIVTKNLGTSLYGAWSLISVTISFIVPFSMLSFSMSIIRFLAAEKDKNKIREDFYSACSLVIVVGAVFSCILFLLSGFIATNIFKDPGLATYLRMASILVLLQSLFQVLLAFFRRGVNIGTYTILNLSLNMVNFGLTILFILRGYSLTGVILAMIIGLTILCIVALAIIMKQIGVQRPHFSNMKSYLKWGIPLTPNSAILWIITASDRYIISYFLGVSAAGIYNAAYSIGSYASFALLPVGIVLYPNVSKTYDEGNRIECVNYFQYSFKYLMMISIPAAVGLSVLARPLLQVLTTPEFISGSPVVALVAFGALFHCFQQICIYVFHLVGKTYMTVRILGIGAVLNITLNIVLIPRLGIFGAAMGSLIAYCVLGMLTLYLTRRYLKFDLSIPFMMKSLVSSAFMALAIWIIRPETIFTIIISIVVGIVVYFVILLIIRGFSKTELSFFSSFVRRSIKRHNQ
jgi:O-antigen/teichoic acid export membrane protein